MKKRIIAAALAVCMLFGTTLPVFAQETEVQADVSVMQTEEKVSTDENAEPGESPAPTESPEPSASPEPTESPEPSASSEPSESPVPTETPAATPGAITGFDALADDVAALMYDYKPMLAEVEPKLPKTIGVYLDNAKQAVDLDVSWECTIDFDRDLATSYQFRPKWDEATYPLAETLTPEDLPTVVVYLEFDADGRLENPEAALSEQAMYDLLKEKLTDEGLGSDDYVDAIICGIMANMYRESGYNPTAEVVDTNGLISYGLCQWNGVRFTALKAYCDQNYGGDYQSAENQIRFMRSELKSSMKSGWSKIKDGVKNAKDGALSPNGAYAAGYYWAQYFEGCSSSFWTPRGEYARDVLWPKYHSVGQAVVTLSNVSTGVKVAWKAVSGAQKYKVYREDGSGWEKIASGVTGTSYIDSNVSGGKEYKYKVKAYSGSGDNEVEGKESEEKKIVFLKAPGGMTLTNYSDRIQVKWSAVTGATEYRVYRRTASSAAWTKIASTKALKYVDEDTPAGKNYTYVVRAYKIDDNNTAYYSEYSTSQTGYRPYAPTLTAKNANGSVQLSWSKVTGAEQYYIYRSVGSPSADPTAIQYTKDLSYTDSKVKSGEEYYYYISVRCGAYYTSTKKETHTIYLERPTLSSPANVQSGVQLTWSDGGSGVHTVIQRREGTSGSWTTLASAVSGTTYVDTKVTEGKQYSYRVAATKGGFSSSYSSTKTITRPKRPSMSAPTRSGNTITVRWAASTGAAFYEVQRKVDGSWEKTTTRVTTTSYADTKVEPGHVYGYRVRAGQHTYASTYCTSKTYTYLTTPEKPTLVNKTGYVSVTWAAVPNATSYLLYRRVGTSGGYTLLTTTTGRSYNDKTAGAGVQYQYKLIAKAGADSSNWGSSQTIRYLTKPTAFSAAASGTKITLKWGTVKGATGYTVYRRVDSGSWAKLVSTTSLSYADTQVSTDHAYKYYVVATASDSQSNRSDYKTCALLAQADLTSLYNSGSGTTLTWSPVNNASSYEVWRTLNGASKWTKVGTSTSYSYRDTTAVSGTMYQYRVRATASGTVGDYSGIRAICRLGQSTLKNISKTTTGSGTKLYVKWSAVPGATSYYVQRSADGSAWTTVRTTSALTYSDYNVEKNHTYSYRVVAVKDSYTGFRSTAKSYTC